MFIAPKRLLLNSEGKAVEAGPGVSGVLLIAEGAEMAEDEAIKYGLLPGKSRPENQVTQQPEEKKKPAVVETDYGTALPKVLSFGQVEEKQEKPWKAPLPLKPE